MTFLSKLRLFLRPSAWAWPALGAALACFSCNTGEEGNAFLKVHIDDTWLGYDSIQVLLDQGDGRGPQRIFGGTVASVSDLDKIPAEGYGGGPATIVIRAYDEGVIARAEDRSYDGSQEKTLEVIVIVKPGGPGTDTTVIKGDLSLSLLPRDTLVTIGDSVRLAATAKNSSGTISGMDWDLDGDGRTDRADRPGTAAAALAATSVFPKSGTYHPSVTVTGSDGKTLTQAATVRVAQDRPRADAGPDLDAPIATRISLSGSAKDSLGKIVKQEWKVGSGAFAETPDGKIDYRTPATPSDVPAVFRVTDDDGQTALDTAFIHVKASADTAKDALRLDLSTRDTLISIGDSAVFAAGAKNAKGKLAKAAWDLDGDGIADSILALDADTADLRAVGRFPDAGTYHPNLTLTGAGGGTLKMTLTIKVVEDAPTADAGPDLTVAADSTVALAGKAKDGIGKIVKQEWSFAGAPFAAAADGKAGYKAPSAPGDILAVFRATDDDGLTAKDTAIIHVISPAAAALTELTVSGCALSPAFDPDKTDYNCSEPYGTAAVRVTAKAQGSMTLNGSALADGQASAPAALSAGKATLAVKVVNGGAERTYTVSVSTAAASGNQALSALSLSAGTLSPAFAPATLSYSATVASAVASVTVTATLADSTAVLSINSAPAVSGKASAAITLGAEPKAIPIVVTAQNGQVRSYSVTVTRQSGDANLKSLRVSAGTLAPAFAAGTLAYADTVGDSQSSLNVTAIPADSGKASMTLNGSPLGAGKSTAVPLTQKETVLNIVVKAEDSAVAKTYVIKVVRLDDTPPAAPVVALGAYAAPDRPGWSWTPGGGGNGSFRYRLDNADLSAGATATTAASFAPGADLAAGTHTLYVQERDSSGNWSASGKAAVTLAPLEGIADYPLLGHASDTLWANGDATLTQAPLLSQGIYVNGIYTGSGLPNPSDARTPALAGFTIAAFAVELDFKPEGLPASTETVIMGGNSYRWLGARLDSDGKLSLVYNNGTAVKGTVTCAAEAWHTLRLAYAGGTATLTVDGTVTATIAVALASGGDYNFSPTHYGNGSTFKGNWRNLRVYAGAAKIAQYPLSGDARDITGKQTEMTLTNAPFQAAGPGATLAGGYTVNDISTPVLAGLDLSDFRITAEFSIAALPTAANGMPILMGGPSYRWIGTRIDSDGNLILVVNNNVLKATTTKVPVTGKHTVGLRYSTASGVASVYLDGVLAGTQAAASLTAVPADLRLTTTNGSNGSAFKGTLYRVEVESK